MPDNCNNLGESIDPQLNIISLPQYISCFDPFIFTYGSGRKEDIYDSLFFHKGAPFNQGSMYSFDENQVVAAMEKAVELSSTKNTEGLKLQEEFTYKRTVDQLLEVINK